MAVTPERRGAKEAGGMVCQKGGGGLEDLINVWLPRPGRFKFGSCFRRSHSAGSARQLEVSLVHDDSKI